MKHMKPLRPLSPVTVLSRLMLLRATIIPGAPWNL